MLTDEKKGKILVVCMKEMKKEVSSFYLECQSDTLMSHRENRNLKIFLIFIICPPLLLVLVFPTALIVQENPQYSDKFTAFLKNTCCIIHNSVLASLLGTYTYVLSTGSCDTHLRWVLSL